MREYIALFKLRIVALLLFVALVSAIVASRGELLPGRFLILFAAGALASVGASILNHYFDRDIDALSERTRRRPIPAGRVAPHTACWLGIFLVGVAILLSSKLNYLTSIYILTGALVYVVVYTIWLKRRSVLNIVIGGTAGSCAVLAGYAAMEGETSLAAVLAALLVFLWTPPHFWAFAIVHRRAYQQAAVPMLPVVHGDQRAARLIMMHTVLLVQASLLLYALGYFGTIYLAVALLFGLGFVAFNARLMLAPTKIWAWRSYKFSGIYLIAIFAGMLLDIVFKQA
ncbi:heme o synthase [Candidatus Pyrohabitans sp.]